MNIPKNLYQINTSFSKHIAGFQIAWDSTSLGSLKTCPRKYYYELICGWTPKGQAIPLTFGIYYHQVLEQFERYKAQGLSHEQAQIATVRYALQLTYHEGKPWDSGDSYRSREGLLQSTIWYMEQFEDDAMETVILRDGKPAVELSFRIEMEDFPSPTDEPILLCGHMDKVISYGDDLYVLDHKTTKMALTDRYWNQYSPNNQVSLYTLASTLVLDKPARGVIISACQLGVNFVRHMRRPIQRTRDQVLEWYKDTRYWIEKALRYAEQEYYPMNDTACDKYSGCPFREICSADPSVREMYLKSSFDKRIWNPLIPREGDEHTNNQPINLKQGE